MNKDWKNLKVGDKIRIISVPGYDDKGKRIKDYVIQRETITAYKKLIARKRPVIISEIDKDGIPWYYFKLKERGRWNWHSMAVFEEDTNWVKVKPRIKK